MHNHAYDTPALAPAPAESEYRKSSYSGENAQCVEVALGADGGRWVRDSKNRNQPPHHFTATEWDAFLRGVKDGEFD